eukprot:2564537-Amphidinium_carterae.1
MGTVGRIGGPVGLELGAGFILAPTLDTGTKASMTFCGGSRLESLGEDHLGTVTGCTYRRSIPRVSCGYRRNCRVCDWVGYRLNRHGLG